MNILLSFVLSLSCKLQLIDVIMMVSAICLVGRQTILVCLFPENCQMGSQENKRDKWMEN